MKKKRRKPGPSAPLWAYSDRNNCWNCPDKNGCNNCKLNKGIKAEQLERRNRIYKTKLKSVLNKII